MTHEAHPNDGDDELVFAEEPHAVSGQIAHESNTWKLLIVDDDQEVHNVTRMVLADFRFAGKPLHFVSAYSASEAQDILRNHDDIAVILLDVVMETEDAGLKLAAWIREDLQNRFVRIVLRTGQPGMAPEEQVILQYDINDYKSKTELTVTRLFTTIVASLRAYRDIMTLEANKKGLEKILDASAGIFEIQAIERFAQGVLQQLTSLLHLEEDALYAKASGFAAHGNGGEKLRIFSGTGVYADYIDKDIDSVVDGEILDMLSTALREKCEVRLDNNRYAGYFRSDNGTENLLYLQGVHEDLPEWDRYLLKIYCNNVAIAFDNISLNNEIKDTQREIIFKLGEIVETRSRETGNHVKRVAEYSVILAKKLGMSQEEIQGIRFASPMHDVGKVGVPDAILNKPERLTDDEMELMKSHTTIGHDMLSSSSRELLKTAAVIALQHHERYDGTGYPHGLAGDAIHILGRITAIADVFDALGVERSYKHAWSDEDILAYFRENRGKHFDPKLTDLFFECVDEFIAVRNAFPDVIK